MHRKPIFDAVRKMLDRQFQQYEVERLDRAIDEALRGIPEVDAAEASISEAGIALIKAFEGCATIRGDGMIEAYPDPGTGGDPWTIGWGATHMDGRSVCRGDCITQEQADALLAEHLTGYAEEVARALDGAPTTQPQFDALVSFHYNTGAIHRATLTKKHKEGDYDEAALEFTRWNRAGGRVMKGLVRRRKAEMELYSSGT